ncbi:uncharacterized protein LOC103179712 isoform X2 [Callorhinchus milii]|uniref:uncharacterized protein LOC103179712 isoform X2 n=1 Tax=Callorhinchus milii TaxID=7868 RepID=UPI000457540C|nr:uncharacterized protein LOC103179712 isoform X2 [Callorhinchus milii]XP_042202663.1 uncharacterized protein LOC103179712 isoform X2 [Callorhinchus milii]|eukprot:gi/632955078/ref/XP_007893292.1/ PREDICTED: calcium-binding tyrosine phosphorylation-regulated protein isoform X2 [Callorhinchus milii]
MDAQERVDSISTPEEESDQNEIQPSGKSSCVTLASDPVVKPSVTEVCYSIPQPVSKISISDVTLENNPGFVYIYTNGCSEDQGEEPGFACIYTNSCSMDHTMAPIDLKHMSIDQEASTEQVTCNMPPDNLKNLPEPVALEVLEEMNQIHTDRFLGYVEPIQADNGIIHSSVHKPHSATHKTEPASSETYLAHRALSLDTALCQKVVSLPYKVVPVHAEPTSVHSEYFTEPGVICKSPSRHQEPELYSEITALDKYNELLGLLDAVPCVLEAVLSDQGCVNEVSHVYYVDKTSGDHNNLLQKVEFHERLPVLKTRRTIEETVESELAKMLHPENKDVTKKYENENENINESAILKSIKTQDDLNVNSILSEDGITVSQQASGSAIEQSQSLISCNLSQSSGHQLDLNLDSELTSTQHQTEQESPVIDDDFEKVHLRLDELGSKMQGLMHNVRILITTVKEIHSAMNINAQ